MPPLRAETRVEVWTLDQAIETATARNPQFKALQAQLNIRQAEILTAGQRRNPFLLSDNGVAEKTYRLGLEQTFELGGKRRKRIAVAEAQRQVTLAEIQTALLDLRADVRRAYTQLFNAQQREKAYQSMAENTDKLLAMTTQRDANRGGAQMEILAARIAHANLLNDLQTATYQVIEARTRLSMLLASPLSPTAQLTPPSPVSASFASSPASSTEAGQKEAMKQTDPGSPNSDPWTVKAWSFRPELQELSQREQMSKAQLALAQANRIPDLSLATGPDLVAEPGQQELNVFVIGIVELPILNRQRGPIQEILAQRNQIEQERLALKNQIAYEVIRARAALQTSQERIRLYESELLDDAHEVEALSLQNFEKDKGSILIPLQAQQTYIATQLGYLQALMDYQNAISDLERALGASLDSPP